MRKRSVGQWIDWLEYWLRKIPFTFGALWDWLLHRMLGVGLATGWSEFELSEVIRTRSSLFRGRQMAPHCFQLSIGWRQYQESNGRTLADWERWLSSAAKAEIGRQGLSVFAPVQTKARVNLFSETIRVEANFGTFESTLLAERRRQAGVSAAERPHTIQCCYQIITQTSIGKQQRRLPFRSGQDRLYLGSSRDCDVVLEGEGVSPVHAVLFLNAQGQLLLADLGSETGTWLAEQKLSQEEIACVGDEICILIGSTSLHLCKE